MACALNCRLTSPSSSPGWVVCCIVIKQDILLSQCLTLHAAWTSILSWGEGEIILTTLFCGKQNQLWHIIGLCNYSCILQLHGFEAKPSSMSNYANCYGFCSQNNVGFLGQNLKPKTIERFKPGLHYRKFLARLGWTWHGCQKRVQQTFYYTTRLLLYQKYRAKTFGPV